MSLFTFQVFILPTRSTELPDDTEKISLQESIMPRPFFTCPIRCYSSAPPKSTKNNVYLPTNIPFTVKSGKFYMICFFFCHVLLIYLLPYSLAVFYLATVDPWNQFSSCRNRPDIKSTEFATLSGLVCVISSFVKVRCFMLFVIYTLVAV